MSRRCPEDDRVFFGRHRGISATSKQGRSGKEIRDKGKMASKSAILLKTYLNNKLGKIRESG